MQALDTSTSKTNPRWLITIRTPSGVFKVETDKDRLVIGSLVSADVRLELQGVAPIHAVIEMDQSGETVGQVYDLASETGMRVDGQITQASTVKNGSSIEVASALIQFTRIPAVGLLPADALLLVQNDGLAVPIFDHRPSLAQCLEVVCSWNGTILQVRHFQNEALVTLGSGLENDFVVPLPKGMGKTFLLASQVLGQWTIKLHESFHAVLFSGGKVQTIEGQARSVDLQASDFARLSIGSLTFYVSKTQAPPKLLHRGGFAIDPLLSRTLILSAALTLSVFFGISQMTPEQNIEAEQLPERVVTILYQPEAFQKKVVPEVKPEPPVPEPIMAEKKSQAVSVRARTPKKLGQKLAASGEGMRARGNVGRRGERKTVALPIPQRQAMRTAPQAGLGRGGAKSATPDNGNVEMLKGASNRILDLLGGSGEKLGKAGKKLEGFGGFSTKGSGGLALNGSAQGGGGTANSLLGGAGAQNREGGRVGTGLSAEGTGRGIVGGRTRVELQTGEGEETIILGSIDREAVQAAINARRDEFRYCYEREINTGGTVGSGRVTTTFTIGSSGRASQLGIISSSLGLARVERCVLDVLGRIQFPKARGGGSATITYPFEFNSAKP